MMRDIITLEPIMSVRSTVSAFHPQANWENEKQWEAALTAKLNQADPRRPVIILIDECTHFNMFGSKKQQRRFFE